MVYSSSWHQRVLDSLRAPSQESGLRVQALLNGSSIWCQGHPEPRLVFWSQIKGFLQHSVLPLWIKIILLFPYSGKTHNESCPVQFDQDVPSSIVGLLMFFGLTLEMCVGSSQWWRGVIHSVNGFSPGAWLAWQSFSSFPERLEKLNVTTQ